MNKLVIGIAVVFALGVIVASQATFVVREGEQVVVTQFGKPVSVVTEAGLQFRTPFVQKIIRLEKRLLPWDGDPENITTRDKKQIFIDVWARWRIADAQAFFESQRSVAGGQKTLDDIVDSAVRDVVARNRLVEAVRTTDRELVYASELVEEGKPQEKIETGREQMEKDILAVAQQALQGKQYGIKITDVHIKRVNYVQSVRQTVYDRMISERQRIKSLYLSEAEEERNRILGLTGKELDVILGEANRRSAEIRGQADAEVIRITAEAYSRAPEFYGFLRQLEAYKASLQDGTRLVLSTDNDFLKTLMSGSP